MNQEDKHEYKILFVCTGNEYRIGRWKKDNLMSQQPKLILTGG